MRGEVAQLNALVGVARDERLGDPGRDGRDGRAGNGSDDRGGRRIPDGADLERRYNRAMCLSTTAAARAVDSSSSVP